MTKVWITSFLFYDMFLYITLKGIGTPLKHDKCPISSAYAKCIVMRTCCMFVLLAVLAGACSKKIVKPYEFVACVFNLIFVVPDTFCGKVLWSVSHQRACREVRFRPKRCSNSHEKVKRALPFLFRLSFA